MTTRVLWRVKSRRPRPDPTLADIIRAMEESRPRTRADCVNGPRPCLYLSCKYHLYLDVTRAGTIKSGWPTTDPWDIPETCALDVADRGGHTNAAIGRLMGIVRARVEQIERQACRRLKELVDP